MDVQRSDLEKVLDVVSKALVHHEQRDASNAALHLAETVRWSPLTSELSAAEARLRGMLNSEPAPGPWSVGQGDGQ